jgi:hypothetical protein
MWRGLTALLDHNLPHLITRYPEVKQITVKPVLRGHIWEKEKVAL